jgi:magnesium-transporting ATPase (P-type)
MFTTGTKFLIGSTVLAIVAAIAYGVTQDSLMGTVGLVSAALALAFLTGVNIYNRDCNVFATPDLVAERTPAAKIAPSYSLWPVVFAFGAVTVVVGLVTYQAILIIGLIVLLAGGADWMM